MRRSYRRVQTHKSSVISWELWRWLELSHKQPRSQPPLQLLLGWLAGISKAEHHSRGYKNFQQTLNVFIQTEFNSICKSPNASTLCNQSEIRTSPHASTHPSPSQWHFIQLIMYYFLWAYAGRLYEESSGAFTEFFYPFVPYFPTLCNARDGTGHRQGASVLES